MKSINDNTHDAIHNSFFAMSMSMQNLVTQLGAAGDKILIIAEHSTVSMAEYPLAPVYLCVNDMLTKIQEAYRAVTVERVAVNKALDNLLAAIPLEGA